MFDLLTHPATKNLNKMCHQSRNVFATDPQRWQDDREHVQTIVEVAAKCVPLHHVGQISVGGSHEPNVHLVSACAAQALEFLLLQYTQQLGLQCQWNIAHFVQEEGPFVGYFKTAHLLGDSASKSALLMAKKLALE